MAGTAGVGAWNGQPPRTGLRLVPLGAASDPRLLAAVLALRALPDQERFAIPAAETFTAAAADPDRTPFAVVRGTSQPDEPVGFGVLDRVGHLGELVDDPSRAVLLRAFYVAAGFQGRGYGTAAARATRTLAAAVAPDAQLVVLTVDAENPAAIAAYARAGFVDTGGRRAGRGGGQELVLAATVVRRPTANGRTAETPRQGAGHHSPSVRMQHVSLRPIL